MARGVVGGADFVDYAGGQNRHAAVARTRLGALPHPGSYDRDLLVCERAGRRHDLLMDLLHEQALLGVNWAPPPCPNGCNRGRKIFAELQSCLSVASPMASQTTRGEDRLHVFLVIDSMGRQPLREEHRGSLNQIKRYCGHLTHIELRPGRRCAVTLSDGIRCPLDRQAGS